MLEGQVALVTGAGRGLGRAFAERLAALGCHIAVHRMREHGPSEYGGSQTLSDVARSIAEAHRVRTVRILADLTQVKDVERTVATATAELGPIDVLVHNAGGDIAAGDRRRACNRREDRGLNYWGRAAVLCPATRRGNRATRDPSMCSKVREQISSLAARRPPRRSRRNLACHLTSPTVAVPMLVWSISDESGSTRAPRAPPCAQGTS